MPKNIPYRRILFTLLLAAAVATAWVYITRKMYNYNLGFGTIMGLNIFPLIGWTVALSTGYLGATYAFDRLGIRGATVRFLVFAVCCFTVVVVAETLGYYVLGVRNLGTRTYEGLAFCNCLHAPAWMQLGYFLMGPVYWLTYASLKKSAPYVAQTLRRF